jgi:chromosome segregation ATPase
MRRPLGRYFKNIGGNLINIQIPTSLEYNTENAKQLVITINSLRSIKEITEWNKKASAEVEELHSIINGIEGKQQHSTQLISKEQQEYKSKTFINKLFDRRKEQKRLLVEQSRLDREKSQIENIINQFESAIDIMPKSLDEVKKLLQECKQQKKELLTEKKTVNDQMSSIRVDAKQQTANTNYGKYGKGDRRLIRLNKDAALRPQESQKMAIKGQITKLDQMIIWLERVKE